MIEKREGLISVWALTAGVLFLTGAGNPPNDGKSACIQFEDVTERAGLKLEVPPSSDKHYIMESTGGGVAFLDYDGDGWLDVYLVASQTVEGVEQAQIFSNRLYHNNGNGTFSDVTEQAGLASRSWGMGVSVADFDKDGHVDIYLTNFGPNILYRNKGDGTFTDVTEKAGVGDPRYSASSAWGDYDGDGHLDLFVANYVEIPKEGKEEYCLFKNQPVQCGPRGFPGARNTLYRNHGDGTFTDVSIESGVDDEHGYYGLGAVWADFDNDADLDLYVANDTHPNYLYWNQGHGKFVEAGLISGVAVDSSGRAQAGMGVAVGDYDNDGNLDLSVTNFSEDSNSLYRNLGIGAFEERAFPAGIGKPSFPYVGWGTFFADFDQDGWKELFAVNGHVYPQADRISGLQYQQPCLLFQNLRNGEFADITARAGAALTIRRSHRGAALGDYDNDGDQDLLLMDIDDGPVLLENRTAGQGNFLRIKAPVGSRIIVESGGHRQIDEIRASGSYLSASEQVAHFGLGAASLADRVTVRLAGGKTLVRENVRANQTLVIPANVQK